MRLLAFAIMAIVTVLAAAPARAQAYDPSYPVCLQTYEVDGSSIQCRFTSMAECASSSSGRGAQCIINPYFGNGRAPGPIRPR